MRNLTKENIITTMQGIAIDESVTKKFSKSNIIVYQGDAPKDGYLIKRGVVRVYQIGSNGESLTVTFCTEGDMFPFCWITDTASPALYYYEAFEDTEVQTINKDYWAQVLSRPGACEAYSKYLISNYQASMLRISALEQAKARDKIAYTVFYLLIRHSREIMPGIFRVDLKLKHQDIAALVGLTRETTAIEMHALQEAKILSYQNQRYLIKRERLLGIINEEGLRYLELNTAIGKAQSSWF